MGMYTELYISALVKVSGRDKEAFLRLFTNENTDNQLAAFADLHDAFKLSRVQFGMIPGGCSHYFVPMSTCQCEWNEIADAYCLTFRCDLKNYEDEIETFMDWLMPHIDAEPGEHIGHMRYENDDAPTLLYKS